jgi:hypothetical protein
LPVTSTTAIRIDRHVDPRQSPAHGECSNGVELALLASNRIGRLCVGRRLFFGWNFRFGVDFARSPNHRGMTALCAFLPLLGPIGNACSGSIPGLQEPVPLALWQAPPPVQSAKSRRSLACASGLGLSFKPRSQSKAVMAAGFAALLPSSWLSKTSPGASEIVNVDSRILVRAGANLENHSGDVALSASQGLPRTARLRCQR